MGTDIIFTRRERSRNSLLSIKAARCTFMETQLPDASPPRCECGSEYVLATSVPRLGDEREIRCYVAQIAGQSPFALLTLGPRRRQQCRREQPYAIEQDHVRRLPQSLECARR
jgi:hypothetical protein